MHSIPNIPDGYAASFGPPGDLKDLVSLIGAVEARYDGEAEATESVWAAIIGDPLVDPTLNHLRITEADTGELVAFGRYVNTPPHLESMTRGFVHPEHEGRGLGTCIVEWGLARSRETIAQAEPETRVTNILFANDTNTGAADLFLELGYSVSRFFLEMERILDEPVAVFPLPEDVTLRTMRGPEDIDVIVDPIAEAFRDHYGFVERSRETEVEEWERWRTTEQWDDSLVWIAEESGVPIAVIVAIKSLGARTDTGYIPSLSVVREWRGQGIAKALLTTAFAEFQRRGHRSVALHVDADSLTGAMRLYESVGMHQTQRHSDYTYELRSGTDLVVR